MPDGEIHQVQLVKTAIRVEMRFVLREPVEIAASKSPVVGIDRGSRTKWRPVEECRPAEIDLWITLDRSVPTW